MFVAALTAGLNGCSPAAPAPIGNPSPLVNPPVVVSLYGKVVDNAWRTVSGARVEVVSGESAGASATTNDSGAYQISGAFSGTLAVQISKAGYDTTTSKVVLPRNSPTDFVLPFLGPSADLTGSYTVTFTADAACTQLPETARVRSYEAWMRSYAPGRYSAELQGASFYSNSFTASAAGSAASFQTDAVGNHIHERLNSATSLMIEFAASAPVDAATVTVPMFARFSYCPADTPADSWTCQVPRVTCSSSNNTFTLTLRHR